MTPAFRTTEEFYYALFDASASERERMLAELAGGRESLTHRERSLFDRAMFRSEPESLVSRLRSDIERGRLPRVSWLVPSAVDSEHPGASTPVGSANLIYDVLDAIASEPDVWSTSRCSSTSTRTTATSTTYRRRSRRAPSRATATTGTPVSRSGSAPGCR